MGDWINEIIKNLIVEKPKSKIQVSQASNFGNFPFYTSGEKVMRFDDFIEDEENIFLATGGLANAKYFNGKVAYSSDTYTITSNNKIDCKYLFYCIAKDLDVINSKYFLGSGLKHLQKKDFKNHKISIPKHKSEQEIIISILTCIEQAIERTELNITKHKRIKTGLMQDLLTFGIDEEGNIRSKRTHKFKDSLLGKIPIEWEVEKLHSLAEISSGITLGKKHEGENTVLLPYLRVANVQDGYLDLKDIAQIRIPKSNVQKYRLQFGDVLMNEGGDFDKLGRGAVWEGQVNNCLHQNHVFKVRCNLQLLNPYYLALYSESPFGKKFFVLNSKQSTNLASINSTQLKKFPIPRPHIEEQNRIIEIIKSEKNIIQVYFDELEKLNRLKFGLMQDLLTGKVRVDALQKKSN